MVDQWKAQVITHKSEETTDYQRQTRNDGRNISIQSEELFVHQMEQGFHDFQHPQALTSTINELLQSVTKLSNMSLLRDKGTQEAEAFAQRIVINQKMKILRLEERIEELMGTIEALQGYANSLEGKGADLQ